MIFSWHGADQQPRSWEPPPLAEPEWRTTARRTVIVRTHPQDLGENLFDEAHLIAVHGYSDSTMERPRAEGHVICGSSRFKTGFDVGPFKRRNEASVSTQLHGLGIFFTDLHTQPGDLKFRTVFMPTPIEPGVLELRVSIWIKQVDQELAALPLIRRLPKRTLEWLVGTY